MAICSRPVNVGWHACCASSQLDGHVTASSPRRRWMVFSEPIVPPELRLHAIETAKPAADALTDCPQSRGCVASCHQFGSSSQGDLPLATDEPWQPTLPFLNSAPVYLALLQSRTPFGQHHPQGLSCHSWRVQVICKPWRQ